MNGNIIEIIIRAIDEASEPIKRFKDSFEELKRLNAEATKQYSDAQVAAAAFAQTIGVDTVNGINRAVVGLRRAITVVKAFIAAWVFGKLVNNIAEAEHAQARLDAAFKNTGDTLGITSKQLDLFARRLSQSTEYSSNAVKEAMAAVLANENVQGEVFQRTMTAAADVAAATGRDIVSTSRMIARALQDPVRGTMMLTRAQIVFTAEERKTIQALYEQGKALEAQKVILDIVEKRYGGTAKTMRNTLGGAIAGVKNALSDMFEATTSQIRPAINALNELAGVLQDPAVVAGVATMIEAIAGLVGWLGKLIGKLDEVIDRFSKMRLEGMKRLLGGEGAPSRGAWGVAGDILGAATGAETGTITDRLNRYREKLVNAQATLASQEVALKEAVEKGYELTANEIRNRMRQTQARIADIKEEISIWYAVEQELIRKIGNLEGSIAKASRPRETRGRKITDPGYTANLANARAIAGIGAEIMEGIGTDTEIARRKIEKQIEQLQLYIKTFDNTPLAATVNIDDADIERARRSIALLKQQLADIPVDPKLKEAITGGLEAIRATETEVEAAKRAVIAQIAALEGFMSVVGSISDGTLKALGGTREEANRAAEALGLLQAQLALVGDMPGLRQAKEAIASLQPEIVRDSKELERQIALIDKYLTKLPTLTAQEAEALKRDFGGELPTVDEAKAARAEAQQQLVMLPHKEAFDEAKRAVEQLRTPVEAVIADFAAMKKALEEAIAVLRKTGGDPEALRQFEEAWARLPEAQAKALEEARRQTDIWLAFQKRAAERLQDAWSNAFMQIGHGWKRFGESIRNAMKQILAEAMSLKIMQTLKIDKFIEEGLDSIFKILGVGGKKKAEEKPKAEEPATIAESVRQGVEGALTQMPDPCECMATMVDAIGMAADRIVNAIMACCEAQKQQGNGGTVADAIGSVLQRRDTDTTGGTVADAIGGAVQQSKGGEGEGRYGSVGSIITATEGTTEAVDSTKPVITSAGRGTATAVMESGGTLADTVSNTSGALGRVFENVGGVLGQVFTGVGNKLAGLLASLRGGQKSDQWMKWAETIGSIVAAYYGGMAGGGTVPRTNSSGYTRMLVGEEGPEMAMLPVGTKILNSRQLAFNGMGVGGGTSIMHFTPVYDIRIENASDARRTRDQLESYLTKRDNQLMDRVSLMLKDNGFGRMR